MASPLPGVRDTFGRDPQAFDTTLPIVWREPVEVFQENKRKVLEEFKQGSVTYIDLSSWTFADRFFAFLFSIDFLGHAARTYPSPRVKEELPLWVLICCALQMKLHTTSSFSRLPGILGSGAILSRLGYNAADMPGGGFNLKNRTERTCPVDHDSVRKFYNDGDHRRYRHWYNTDVQTFFHRHHGFDKHGIFVLDQTHLVVPGNPNYVDVAPMPVDEHGRRIDMSEMSEEQKRAVRYRPCYALSELLHVFGEEPGYLAAEYHLDKGNTDELPGACEPAPEIAAVGNLPNPKNRFLRALPVLCHHGQFLDHKFQCQKFAY